MTEDEVASMSTDQSGRSQEAVCSSGVVHHRTPLEQHGMAGLSLDLIAGPVTFELALEDRPWWRSGCAALQLHGKRICFWTAVEDGLVART